MKNKPIGTIIIRPQTIKTANGRRIVAIVGIVSVPEGHPFDSEDADGLQFAVTLTHDSEPVADHSETARSYGLGDLLCLPIWRVS